MSNDYGLDDAQLASILASIRDPSALDDVNDSLAAARKLRDQESPGTIPNDPFNAPNYGGMVGDILANKRGAADEAAAKAEREKIYSRQQDNLQTLIDAWRRGGAMGAPVAPAAPPAAPPAAGNLGGVLG